MDVLDRADDLVANYDRLAPVVSRWGLATTILLAGAHKLVAPAAWHRYLAPQVAAVWPTGLAPLDPTFVLFGVSELLFAALLFADWHTPTVAGVTALSLYATVGNLALGVAAGEPVADVLVRDLGLGLWATAVALGATRSP